ncbi:MAG: hypothetical protein AAGK74_03560 [Chloroflexota bacterium]
MPARVEKLMGESIALVTYYGHITLADAEAVIAQTATLLDDYGAPLYRVICVDCEQEAHASFDEVMMLTTLSSRRKRGSVTDPNVLTVLVGEHILIDLYVDAMRQEAFGGVDIPLFGAMDDALVYVRAQIHMGGAAGVG